MFLGGPGGRFSEPRRASVRNEARRRLEDRQRDLSDLLKEAGVDPLRQGCPGRALEEAVAGSALRNRLPGKDRKVLGPACQSYVLALEAVRPG